MIALCKYAWVSDPRASNAVAVAVARGLLPPVTTLRCKDCGRPAAAYDHYKGYARRNWLTVEPVCDRCNALRAKRRRVPQGDHAAVVLRLSVELIAAIDGDARSDFRSRNAQIEWVLREHCRGRGLVISEDAEIYDAAA